MSKRKWIIVPVTLAALAGATVSFAGAATAASTPSSDVECETTTLGGGPALDCLILTAGEFQSVRVSDLTTHNNNFIRSGAIFGNELAFKVTPGDRYKVTVISDGGVKDTYKVLTDGTVTIIHVGGI